MSDEEAYWPSLAELMSERQWEDYCNYQHEARQSDIGWEEIDQEADE